MKTATQTAKTETEHVSLPMAQRKQDFFSTKKSQTKPFFGPAFIQAKLEIGQPNDPYEREADKVADQVMRMPDTSVQMGQGGDTVQRKSLVKRNTAQNGGDQTVSPEISSKISSTRGSGNPLPKSTQNEMGSKIGADFSGVKIHTDNNAVQLSQDLGAKAFTVGNDVYFNQGQYNPNSGEGKRLMAHELVHTVQQGEGIRKSPNVMIGGGMDSGNQTEFNSRFNSAQQLTRISYATLRRKAIQIAQAYEEAWNNLNTVINKQTVLSQLGTQLVLSAFNLASAGIGKALASIVNNAIQNKLVFELLWDVLDSTLEGSIEDSLSLNLDPISSDPTSFRDDLNVRILREEEGIESLLFNLNEDSINRDYWRRDPLSMVENAIRINGLQIEEIEVSQERLALKYERNLWIEWLIKNAILQPAHGVDDPDISYQATLHRRERSMFYIPNSGSVFPHLLNDLGPENFSFEEIKAIVFGWPIPLSSTENHQHQREAMPNEPL
jgi:hypothetical protein